MVNVKSIVFQLFSCMCTWCYGQFYQTFLVCRSCLQNNLALVNKAELWICSQPVRLSDRSFASPAGLCCTAVSSCVSADPRMSNMATQYVIITGRTDNKNSKRNMAQVMSGRSGLTLPWEVFRLWIPLTHCCSKKSHFQFYFLISLLWTKLKTYLSKTLDAIRFTTGEKILSETVA